MAWEMEMSTPPKIHSEYVCGIFYLVVVICCFIRRYYGRFPRIAKNIKSRYRLPAQLAEPVTFNEFIRYVLDPKAQERPVDRHWRPYYELCQPCQKHYDFIGHYETLQADVDYVLQKLGLSDNNISFASPQRRYNSSNLIQRFFAEVTTNQSERLYQHFRIDFDLFGYKWPL